MKTLLLALVVACTLTNCSTAPSTASRHVLVLGKTQARMAEVLALLHREGFQAEGVHTESAAAEKLRTNPKVDALLLGGAVEEPTRERLRALLQATHPQARTSEPGVRYPYSDTNIVSDLRAAVR